MRLIFSDKDKSQSWLEKSVAKGSNDKIKSMATALAIKMNVGVADQDELINDLEDLIGSLKQYYQ